MSTCPNCGAQIPDGATFCPNCGTAFTQVNTGAQGQQAPEMNQQAPNQQPYQNFQQAPNQPYQNFQQPMPDPKDHTAEYDAADISENKVIAMSCYLLGVFGIIISLLAARDSAYSRFHSRQAMKIIICQAFSALFAIVPVIGWIACAVCEVILIVVDIICVVRVGKGQAKEAPIVSSFNFLK